MQPTTMLCADIQYVFAFFYCQLIIHEEHIKQCQIQCLCHTQIKICCKFPMPVPKCIGLCSAYEEQKKKYIYILWYHVLFSVHSDVFDTCCIRISLKPHRCLFGTEHTRDQISESTLIHMNRAIAPNRPSVNTPQKPQNTADELIKQRFSTHIHLQSHKLRGPICATTQFT